MMPGCADDAFAKAARGGAANQVSRALIQLRRVALAALCALSWPALADPADAPPYSAPVQRVADILEKIKANYVEPIDDTKLVTGAVNGVLRSLDPHSAYLDAEAFRELYNDNRGEYGGLGLEVAMHEGGVKVAAVVEGGPAARAGMQAGDVIVAVDGGSVQGQSLEQVIGQVRGERGTQVDLTVARGGEGETRAFTLTRELIHGRSVWVSLIEPGYAYVRLSQFQVHTPESLVAGLTRFLNQDDGRVAGIVLDLRDNPGGLLSAAVGVSAVFLPAGAPVVFTEGMAKDAKMRLFAQREDYLRYGADRPSALGAAGIEDPADGRAGQRRVGLRCRDRCRCAAGQPARHRAGHAHLRQGLGAGRHSVRGRHRHEAHHGLLPHAQRPSDPRQRRYARRGGRRSSRLAMRRLGRACVPSLLSVKATRRLRVRLRPYARRVPMPSRSPHRTRRPTRIARLPGRLRWTANSSARCNCCAAECR